MARDAEARVLSNEQKAAHVRKTRMANYHASMRLEGFYVQEDAELSNKKTLIRKYKQLAMKRA